DNLKNQAKELEVRYKFDNWEHVDQRLQNTYYQVDKTISKKVFECHHASKPQIYNKNNTTSSYVECTCYININWPKSDANPQVTTFEPKHANHDLNLITTKFALQYRSLSEPQDSCNENSDLDNDAFLLLNALESQQNNDPGIFIAKKTNMDDYETSASYIWVFEQLLSANNNILPLVLISDANTGLDAAVKTFLPNVKHIHYIFHLRQNLDRYLQSTLVEKFPSASTYLVETLNKIKESWAKAFIC
ncbi:14825_t:CDS:2, partial [Racocetra persica]